MRKTVFALFAAAFCAFAEYQVFDYAASFKVIAPCRIKASGEESSGLESDKLSGLLVTVACYPCQASFGKGYPSWLYVVRNKDASGVLWKIPVSVNGGIFGEKASAKALAEWDDLDNWAARDAYVKKNVSRAWFAMDFSSCSVVEEKVKDVCGARIVRTGVLGGGTVSAAIIHSGYGTSAWKTNSRLDPDIRFNAYVKSASGSLSGRAVTLWKSSSDLVNYSAYMAAPVTGTFTVKFNAKMTEKIRGNADWSKIDAIIFANVKHRGLCEEPGDVSLQDTEY